MFSDCLSFYGMKVFILAISLLSTSLFTDNSSALLGFSPFGFMLKPYVGFDITKPTTNSDLYSINDISTSRADAMKLRNINFIAGLRIHKYFGVEVGYEKFNKNFSIHDTGMASVYGDQSLMSFNSKSTNLMLYLPIFDILGNRLELYSSLGVARVSGSIATDAGTFVTNQGVMKLGAGVQASLFGTLSARAGVDYYNMKIHPVMNNGIFMYKVGLSMYFL